MDYKKAFEKYTQYQQDLHEKNQNKIRVGLKVNILLPLVFLFMSFFVKDSKLIFLILWIVSLFGIAAYLVYIEYSDYKLQEQLMDFSGETEKQADSLIGAKVEIAEAEVNRKMDAIDARIDEGKQKVMEKIEKLKEDDNA
ncbi:MAG: hypothetical protein K6F30_03825 [Lachnospiraceae bacterium]|nr:hypothetical protein [Lachnospiraceae bacterium]